MVQEPDTAGLEREPQEPDGAITPDTDNAYLDENGNTYYLADDGSAYYLDEDGKPYYIADDGNAYYFADTGEGTDEGDAFSDVLEAEPVAEQTGAGRKRRDPLVQLLALGVFLLTVVGLAAAGGMIWYMLSMRGAPRTAIERNIYTLETAVKENPKDAEGYLKLAYAYMEADRFSDARAIVAKGQKIKDVPAFELALSDMLREEGRYEQAVKAYTEAEVAERKKLAELKNANEKQSITMGVDMTRLVAILMGRGQTYEDMRDYKKALIDYKKCENYFPLDVEVLTAVGRAELALGNKEKAQKAFEAALKYVPDYKEAQKGLEQLGVK